MVLGVQGLLDEEDDPKVRTSLAGEFFRIQDTHPVNASKGTIAGILLRPLLRETMGVNLNPQEPERNHLIYLRGFGIGEVYKLPLTSTSQSSKEDNFRYFSLKRYGIVTIVYHVYPILGGGFQPYLGKWSNLIQFDQYFLDELKPSTRLYIPFFYMLFFGKIKCPCQSDTHQQNRPRKKKAYVRLTQDYDALDVANRIGSPAAISEAADDFPY